MTKPKKKIKPKEKYPYLWGCYVDTEFQRELKRKYLGATVEISAYKGAMLMRVLPEQLKGKKHVCACPSIQYPAAWLKGDDLEALIDTLKEAKRVWVKAYHQSVKALAKREREKARDDAKYYGTGKRRKR